MTTEKPTVKVGDTIRIIGPETSAFLNEEGKVSHIRKDGALFWRPFLWGHEFLWIDPRNVEVVPRPTVAQRWEKGIPHDPRSVEIYAHIAKLDLEQCKDFFGFKSGGDGDNGEHLMYLLDDYFYDQDDK